MKRMLCLAILMVAGAFGAKALAEPAGPAFAPAPPPENTERFKQNLERWNRMTPEQQAKIRARFEQWKKLTDEQRQKIRANLDRFRRMQADKQQGILRAHRMMGHLQDNAREQLRGRMHEFENLPPERRAAIMQKIAAIQGILNEDMEKLRALPPDSPEAKAFVLQMRMKGMILHSLPPEKIEELKAMTPEARQEAVMKLWEERKATFGPNGEGMRPMHRPGMRPEGDRGFKGPMHRPHAPDNDAH